MGVFVTVLAACAGAGASGDEADHAGGTLRAGTVTAQLPSGALQQRVVEIASDAELLDAVTHNNSVFIHDRSDDSWYFKSGNYLLGIELFTQYHQQFDAWVEFGSGDKVAPARARVVGHSFRGQGWDIPSLASGAWPAGIDSAWVIGTGNEFGMGGAPQGIPLGTEVFGSMQTYGGAISTPYLFAESSPGADSARIRALFRFGPNTLLGGHSAGSSAARRIALDAGNTNAWFYGTPNYSRGSGADVRTEHRSNHTLTAEVINNNDDPVTNVLAFPFSLVSLAWGTARCHDYSHWDYQATSPVVAVCN